MKKFKKLLVLILTFSMLIVNSVPVFGEELPVEGEISISDEAELTVIEEESVEDETEVPLISEETEEIEKAGETEDEEESDKIFPGVEDIGFCSDPEVIANKSELNEHIDDLEGAEPGKDYVEGEILVEAPDEDTARQYADAYGGKLAAYTLGFALITLNNGEDDNNTLMTVKDAVYASADMNIALPAAWPNYLNYTSAAEEVITYISEGDTAIEEDSDLSLSSVYSDPYLDPMSDYFQWQHSLMQSETAWRAGYTGAGVNLVVIDTGIVSSHVDLAPVKKAYCDCYPDGSGNYKYEIIDAGSTGLADDEFGHGTHCAGTSTARLNGLDGAGIAPGANLYVIRACFPKGYKDESNQDIGGAFGDMAIINSILYAVDKYGADVISMSLGGKGYSKAKEAAVDYAYTNGAAIFAASGNGSSNQISYPAAFKHAAAVGAVDQGNTRTFFSDQDSNVRYSGPGWEVYSTGKTNNKDDILMSGTSMATPCVAGAAAVILSSGKISGSGARKVDALWALMDKSTIKSGVGKGTPSLAKALGLNDVTSAPSAPSIQLGKPGTYNGTVTVKFNPVYATKIYYNTNGQNITYKDGIVTNGEEYDFNSGITLDPVDGGKQTIKAITVDDETKLCSKTATFTYSFKTIVHSVSISSKSNEMAVAKGASLQLVAGVSPSCAVNKKVEWSLLMNYPGVDINKTSGKITVSKDCALSEFYVKAKAVDGGNASSTVKITITDLVQLKSIVPDDKKVSLYLDYGTCNLYMTTTAIDGRKINGEDISFADGQKLVGAVSSNESVATIDGCNGYAYGVTPVNPGKTKITLYSKDGTGKCKSVTVDVTILKKVDGIDDLYDRLVVQGGSINQNPTIDPANASNKALKWSLTGFPEGTTAKTCGVSVNAKNGQIKASKNAIVGEYEIKCEAADGRGAYSIFAVDVIAASQKVSKIELDKTNVTVFRVTNDYGAPVEDTVSATLTGGFSSDVSDCISATSSNPNLVEITDITFDGKITVRAKGNSIGTANITVMTKDGTNLKKVFKVKVINPASSVTLSVPAERTKYLQYNCSMKLIPSFVTNYGPLDASSKKLKWTSSDPEYVTVSSNGTVKTVKKYFNFTSTFKEVTITATALDGSGIKAEYTIMPTPKVEMITYDINYYTGVVTLHAYFRSGNVPSVFSWEPVKYKISGPGNSCDVIHYSDKNLGPNASYTYTNQFGLNFSKPGMYTITFILNDGSNKKTSIRCRVR